MTMASERDAQWHTPKLTCVIDTDTVSVETATIDYGLDIAVPVATLRLAEAPVAATPNAPVKLSIGWNAVMETDYFRGEVDADQPSFAPVSNDLTAHGKSRVLNLPSSLGLALTNVTDQQAWEEVVVNLTKLSVNLTVQATHSGTAGLFALQALDLPPGASYLPFLQALDEWLGFATWEAPRGVLKRARVNGLAPAPAVYRAFTEGVNVLSLSRARSLGQARNKLVVEGYRDPATGAQATKSLWAKNTSVPAWVSALTVRLSSELIQTNVQADLAAQRNFNRINRLPIAIRMEIVGDPLMEPGARIQVTAPRLRITTALDLIVTHVTHSFGPTGYTTDVLAEDYYGAFAYLTQQGWTAATVKVKSLWNPALAPPANDAPPAGWETAAYDDTAWTAGVVTGGAGALERGERVWATATPASDTEQVLIRWKPTIPAGTINGGQLTTWVDDQVTKLWVNSVDYGARLTGDQKATFVLDPANLTAGAVNTFALQAANSAPTLAYAILDLEVW